MRILLFLSIALVLGACAKNQNNSEVAAQKKMAVVVRPSTAAAKWAKNIAVALREVDGNVIQLDIITGDLPYARNVEEVLINTLIDEGVIVFDKESYKNMLQEWRFNIIEGKTNLPSPQKPKVDWVVDAHVIRRGSDFKWVFTAVDVKTSAIVFSEKH